MARVIKRDPFARIELVRYNALIGKCDWCGKNGRRYTYVWEADSISDSYIGKFRNEKKFCSIGCYRAYEDQ